ncbi:MAG TPA: iron uptake transporter permease EfeU [Actinomycetota bacterium]|jgi:high-affinity iron transporter|nr:iron uptake transporter permease EfeU [Actinomycetota bacterium]
MGASFVIALREGIEAALIVSIILAYLKQLEATDRSRLVWWGTGLAVAISAAVGIAVFAAGAEFEGRTEEIFEGLVTLAAVAVLTWMIFWMRRQGARIRSELQEKVDTALVTGGLALAGLAFFAVLREGIETALFLFAAAQGTAVEGTEVAPAAQLAGAALGLAVAIVLGVLLYRGGIRMNLRSFFRVTGWILIVVAAGLFAYSLHELQEAGWIPILEAHAYDLSASLPDDEGVGAILRGLVGYNADPTWLEIVGWLGYLVVVGLLYLRPPAAPGSKSRPEHETSGVATASPDRDAAR